MTEYHRNLVVGLGVHLLCIQLNICYTNYASQHGIEPDPKSNYNMDSRILDLWAIFKRNFCLDFKIQFNAFLLCCCLSNLSFSQQGKAFGIAQLMHSLLVCNSMELASYFCPNCNPFFTCFIKTQDSDRNKANKIRQLKYQYYIISRLLSPIFIQRMFLLFYQNFKSKFSCKTFIKIDCIIHKTSFFA